MGNRFKKGCTLFDQIYKEGESTWGCKSGVLDVEDVKNFINEVEKIISGCSLQNIAFMHHKIHELAGEIF